MNRLAALTLEEGAGGEALASRTRAEISYPRVTVRLVGDLGSAIQDLQEITSASTPSEVVRRAIVVYHTLVKQKMAGNNPVIEMADGKAIKKVPIFL